MINITDENLRAAIQICLGDDSIYSEERKDKLVHEIKALSITDVSDVLPDQPERYSVLSNVFISVVSMKFFEAIKMVIGDFNLDLESYCDLGENDVEVRIRYNDLKELEKLSQIALLSCRLKHLTQNRNKMKDD